MAASASLTAPTTRPQSLSYAERAKRAGAQPANHTSAQAHLAPMNGSANTGDGSMSSASSNRNVATSNSSVAATRPDSPPLPQSSSTPNLDATEAFPPIQKSPSKPVLQNVWAARREQMARTAGQQQHATTSVHPLTENEEKSVAAPRAPLNGIMNTTPHEEIASSAPKKSVDDPFVVRMPTHSRSPPSLDDTESWPEMGKPGPSVSASASTISEGSSNTHKKGEKTKWVAIPPSELQATHDALTAQSTANSRAQSQRRRNKPTKSLSRQQSQARQTQGQSNIAQSNGLRQPLPGFGSGEASVAHSRTESTTNSRTTSVHSSPRFPRGRIFPDNRANNMNANAGPSTNSKKIVNDEMAPAPAVSEIRPSAYQHDQPDAIAYPPQSHSGPHSQSHTPYSSHSPVYYAPPPNSGNHVYTYGSLPPNGGYVAPSPPIPSPGHTSTPSLQQNYGGYPPYGLTQHLPPGQLPYSYTYAPVSFSYYAAPAPGQPHERLQHESQQPEANLTLPNLPPASTLTRPPPPEQSAALAGYRSIAAVPVSPLLGTSDIQPNINEVAETSGEMMFGSVGRPGGMKSPSPVSSPVATDDQPRRPIAFAVGFEGLPTIRVKRSTSGRDGVEDVIDALKVLNLTDQETTWEFGTSAHPDAGDSAEKTEGEGASSPNHELPIMQPQPHTMHYPLPPVPPHQGAGYNNVGQPAHLSLPLPPPSPQNAAQLLPQHIPSLAPLPVGPGFMSPLALASPGAEPGGPGPVSAGTGTGDEWEVRDFGYGFGALSGSGLATDRLREDRFEREHRDMYREPREPGGSGFTGPGRGRRGGMNGYGGYFEGRGGFGGRRGRWGPNGFGRGFSRGGFAGRGGYQRHQPALNVATGPFHHHQPGVPTPIGQQQPQLLPHQISPDIPNGYYPPPPTSSSQYVASPYGQYNPGLPPPLPVQPQTLLPVQPQQAPHPPPMPVTVLSFPLDPTRHYLLGQVEYYFSIQNLASDFFLRKQMDSRGWIPIHLIASFNRVRQLTTDTQLVKDILSLSSLVEVRDEHVRLANQQWVNIVLPGAAVSTVDGEDTGTADSQGLGDAQPVGDDTEKDVDEDEEDDVVFVLGEESRPWTIDRERSQVPAPSSTS